MGAQWWEQSDAQFWSNQPDPVLIEMGQTEAIQLVRNTVKTTMTTPTVATNSSTTQPSEGVTEPNMTDTSRVPPMVFIDDEGQEEQFLTGDEASWEVMDITANRMTTPVDTDNDAAPLNPIYTQW